MATQPHDSVIERRQAVYIGARIAVALIGAGLLINAALINRLFAGQEQIAAISSALAAIILAVPVFVRAIGGLLGSEEKAFTEQIISVAILAAMANADFLTAALIPMLMTIGHFLEERSVLGAREAIEGIARLTVVKAHLISDEGEREVDGDQLRPGDHIRLRPGDAIPADGKVLSGNSAVDQSSITGESIPEEAGPGSEVFAGTMNVSGVLEVEVTRVGGATTLGRVKSLVLEAEKSKAPITRIMEQYAEWYLPVVLMIAAAALFYSRDVYRSIAILVAACPCAFVLASPAAMIAALAVAARLGILIKNTKFLEVAAEVDKVVLDKTGTVTLGKLELVSVEPAEGANSDEALAAAFSLARNSRHPASRAVVEGAEQRGIAATQVADFAEIAGKGLGAKTPSDERLLLGRRELLADEGVAGLPEALADGTAVYLAKGSAFWARFILADTPRPEAKAALDALRREGAQRMVMLTGDRESAAQRVGEPLGFDAIHAECLPEQKLDLVKREKADGGTVVVVGDGINDTLALAAGDMGVAMGAMGSDIAIKAADVALMRNDLSRLPLLVSLSKATRHTINVNILFGACFAVAALAFSSMGYVTPVLAALLHNGGAAFVVFYSARLLRFGERA